MRKGIFIFLVLSLFIVRKSFADDKIVEIGIASNFSEISSSSSNPYGDYFRQGIQLALEQNKASLKKKKIQVKITEFDYGTAQMKVVDVANKACRSNAALVLGYVYSSDALLAAPIHQKCGLPLFSPSASADRLSDFKSFVHLAAFSNSHQGRVLAQVAKDRLKAKKALIIYAEDCAYCTDLTAAFESAFKTDPSYKIEKVSLLSTETDFKSVADRAKSHNADVILVPNHELLSSRIIAALIDKGINKPFLGGDGWGNHGEQFLKILAGRQIDGFSLSHWFSDIPTAVSKKFVTDYKTQFGKMPNDTAVLSYDSMNIIVKALLRIKEINRQAVESALNNVKQFDGVTGHFDYSAGGAPQKDIVLLKAGFDNYKFVKIVKAN